MTVPDFRPKATSLSWGAFPRSLLDDVERYPALLGGNNILDEVSRSSQQAEHDHDTTELPRLAASAAVNKVVPCWLLADPISPSTVRLIFEHHLAEEGRQVVTYKIDMAERLYAIARPT